MRIAIVAEPFVAIPPKKYGGIERVIYQLIRGLKELGHDVVLLAPGDSEVDCELIPICKKHFFFGMTEKEQLRIREKNKVVRKKTLAILDTIKHSVDIIHSHGMDLSSIEDTPTVTTLHGMFTLKQMKYFENRKNENWISISNNQREPFPDLNYLATVYNGLDPSDFPIIKNHKDYVCFIGRFDREKAPHLAIEYARAINLPLKLAGKIDFQGKDYFDKHIKPYLKDPDIEYLGELALKEKIDLMGNALCNIHPTNFREPFGLTVLEAAYMGTPTLAIKRGSMPEIIEQDRTGVLVEDIHEGYFKIDTLRNIDRKYVADRARLLFNYQKMAAEYVKAYTSAIEKYKASEKPTREPAKDKYTSTIELFWENDYKFD